MSSEEVALEAAAAGGEVLRRRFAEHRGLTIETKARHDYVTEVDREAEAAIVEVLRRRTPGHAILAEEGSLGAKDSEHRWIVDPLDGTTNFIHGVPTFAVSIGLTDANGLLAGVVLDPCRDETFHAVRGGGAFLNGVPIRCAATPGLESALLATGFPFREMSNLPGYLAAFERFVRVTAGLRRAGSASLDLAYTACGRYDGFFEVGLFPWDLAGGCLLVVEAGGIVSDVHGGADALAAGSVVAAGAALHAAMLEVTLRTL
ncbi:MAG TPA: inositol monophosphatase family protein [Candidatus Polarisedimenticolaceae bacterium]|nr:inositol monophosphatase family protein [Candidatus Polarisedimenticolaceae bacterium]